MNYNENQFCYVVNWQDVSGRSHQDEVVHVGFYDSTAGRSFVHDWNNIEHGLEYFLNPLPKFNTVVYKLSEYSLACLRSNYIVIPTDKLIEYAEEITKITD